MTLKATITLSDLECGGLNVQLQVQAECNPTTPSKSPSVNAALQFVELVGKANPISKEAVIEQLRFERDQAIDRAKHKWIPCDQAKPHSGIRVLVFNRLWKKPIQIGTLLNDDFWLIEFIGPMPTHWMPLPEPPEQKL